MIDGWSRREMMRSWRVRGCPSRWNPSPGAARICGRDLVGLSPPLAHTFAQLASAIDAAFAPLDLRRTNRLREPLPALLRKRTIGDQPGRRNGAVGPGSDAHAVA